MVTEPVEVARNAWASVIHHAESRTLELRWLPATRTMTDDGFKETLALHAGEGERLRPDFMLIDATEFYHQFGDGVLAWRDENIIPRYNAAGIRRFAFHAREGFANTVESGAAPQPEGPARFLTGWFASRERARQWLTGE